ncbi:MAG: adenylate/guanylate cyclase domain-containing protein [Rhizobiaceae bacterium]|nr:adenylate/guanylate cyclase domain-containing protein [Rhizobiaceae bacterium]
MVTRAQQVGVVIGLAIVAALTVLRYSDPPLLKLARDLTFDQYQRLSPRKFENMPVRVVDIDEASLQQFGQWPWPRNRLAMLVDRLSDMGASAIAFDVLFSEPDRLSPSNVVREVTNIDPSLIEKLPDNDKIFAQALENQPVIIGFGLSNEGDYLPPVKAGFAYTGESPFGAPPAIKSATPLRPQLAANAAGIGHISLDPGASAAVTRSIPLFLSDGKQLYPSLALEALRVAQGASTYVLDDAPDAQNRITRVKIGEFVIPVTAAGELWLYVSPDTRERYISVSKVLAPEGAPSDVGAAIQGSIVFVGSSASALHDIRTTALGETVPGVSIHAQIIEQILSGHFLSRPDWADGLEIFSIAVLGSFLVIMTTFVTPVVALVCGLLITAFAILASLAAFLYGGLLFDPLAPIVAGSITHFAATAFRFLVTDRERRDVRRAFGHYLSPSLLYRIEHTRNALRLGGDERELTVMFVDVRNFTQISEQMTPTEVVTFLNTLLDALSHHVIANEGTLDKFIGDSIMAFWNAPIDVPEHAAKAVHAALGMRETLAGLNERDAFGFGPDRKVGIGIGIHTGLACVGNMGAETRFNYSAVGDAVNIASRIESTCKDISFDILVSQPTARLLKECALLEAGALMLKGKSRKTKLFAVVGDGTLAKSAEFLDLQSLHLKLIDALRKHSTGSRKLITAAKQKAPLVAAGLSEFYGRISRRSEHFWEEGLEKADHESRH